jgi:hypothetical protein
VPIDGALVTLTGSSVIFPAYPNHRNILGSAKQIQEGFNRRTPSSIRKNGINRCIYSYGGCVLTLPPETCGRYDLIVE